VAVYCLCMKTDSMRMSWFVIGLVLVVAMLLFPMRILAAPLTVCSSGLTYCPYFKTAGSDLFAGGWFTNASSQCVAANYQNPTYGGGAPSNQYTGAVMTFAEASRAGASSDLGAYALGILEGNAPSHYGFVTGPAGTNSLSFANTGSYLGSNWGGLFEGAGLNSNCIPNYFDTKSVGATSPGSINLNAAKGVYNVGSTTLGGGTVPAGANIAYFVSGDLTITGDVRYAAHTASTSPKFVVVVRGNIYINHTVQQLDGWYIAQSTAGGTPASNDGRIWTCRDGSVGSTDDIWIRTSCKSPLTVNGSLTAKQVNFGRITENGNPLPAAPTEVVNYVPEMALGGGFFNQQNSASGKIQSLISLPPVF
jgi:hypothetical protein